jgi:hypothetical protein
MLRADKVMKQEKGIAPALHLCGYCDEKPSLTEFPHYERRTDHVSTTVDSGF